MKITELDYLADLIEINGEPYVGKIVVGDTIDLKGKVYVVLGINEDAIVVKELLGDA